MNLNIWRDLQICISVHLRINEKEKFFCFFPVSLPQSLIGITVFLKS